MCFIAKTMRTVLYLRLSDEDRDKLTKEQKSESIKNQKIMLTKYALEHNYQIIEIYDDEDWSGADSQRPNFNKMILECKYGHVDIVLVKSQARFARDMELIEKYVHNKFIEWNVKFVTLMEKIDNTKIETKKTSQIIGLTDQWYLEDTSHNIRETFKTKREAGQFTGSFAPYGYMKDPNNKNHLIPDPIVVDHIIRIFEQYSQGYGIEKIAQGLMNDHILSPYEYKLFKGSNLRLPLIEEYNNYHSINKTGTFIISVEYRNRKKQTINNLTTIEVLTDNIFFTKKVNLKLTKIKGPSIQVFYSIKKPEELNITIKNKDFIYHDVDFNQKEKWIPVMIDEQLPNNITCIAVNTKKLEYLDDIYYEFEAVLKENRDHTNYYYKIYPKNLTYKINIRRKYRWCFSTIKKILKDEVYIGNLVQFKTTTVSYKNHTLLYNDIEKQIRVQNTHQPIIEKELWNQVQKKLAESKKCGKNGKTHILANKVYCQKCHNIFYKCGKKDSNGYSYLCCKDKINKWSNCDNNKYIKENDLQEFVINKINFLLKRFYMEDLQVKIYHYKIDHNFFKDAIQNLNQENLDIHKELNTKSTYFQELYEDRKKGFIDDEEYLILRKKYKEDYQKLEDRSKKIESKIFDMKVKQNQLKNKQSLFNNYKQINNLEIEIINDLIDKIMIGEYNQKTNQRNIHIIWNFKSTSD